MRVFPAIYDLIARHRRGVLICFALATVVCAALATRLKLDNDMLNMLPDDIPAVKTVRKLQGWSPDFAANMYLGLVRDDATSANTLKAFADQVGRELESSRWIQPGITVGMDISRVQNALPLFLDPEDLQLVGQELDRAVKAQRKQGSGFYLDLDEQESPDPIEILRPLLPKYAQRFQTRMLDATASHSADDALARLRLKLDPTGTRLYYISQDGKMLNFVFKPVFAPYDLAHYPDLVRDVDQAVTRARTKIPGSESIDVFKGGSYPLQWDQRETTLSDALKASVVGLLLIVFIVVITVRRFFLVALSVVALLVGLVMCGGLSYLAVGKVNVITVFLLAILASLGIDFGLYLSTRFSMFRRAGLGTEDATREAWLQTASPTFMGVVTTMAVMIALAFGQFQGFADLGVICAIGIMSIYLAMYILLPALLLTIGRRDGVPGVTPEAAQGIVNDALSAGTVPLLRFAGGAGRGHRVVLVVTALITVLAIIGIRNLRFAYTGEEIAVKNQRSLQIDRLILKHYGENVDQTAVLADDEAQARRIHQYFEENYGNFSSIERYESVFTYLPPKERQLAALEAISPLQKAIARLPGKSEDPNVQFGLDLAKRMADPQPLDVKDIPDLIRSIYLFNDKDDRIIGYMGAIFANAWLWDYQALERFVTEVESIRVDGKPLQITGRAQIFYRLINIVQKEAVQFSLIGVVLILVMFWLQARSLRFALLSMLPLALGVAWLLGFMPFAGEIASTLNFVNVIAFPILTGMGVSYGVHVVHNYRIYGGAGQAVQVVARPVMGSALTTAVGWGSLLMANMNGMRSIGWVVIMGMTSVTLCSLVVLPAVLAALHRRGWIPV